MQTNKAPFKVLFAPIVIKEITYIVQYMINTFLPASPHVQGILWKLAFKIHVCHMRNIRRDRSYFASLAPHQNCMSHIALSLGFKYSYVTAQC